MKKIENPMNTLLGLKVTTEDADRIKHRAAKKGLATSTYIRQVVLSDLENDVPDTLAIIDKIETQIKKLKRGM